MVEVLEFIAKLFKENPLLAVLMVSLTANYFLWRSNEKKAEAIMQLTTSTNSVLSEIKTQLQTINTFYQWMTGPRRGR